MNWNLDGSAAAGSPLADHTMSWAGLSPLDWGDAPAADAGTPAADFTLHPDDIDSDLEPGLRADPSTLTPASAPANPNQTVAHHKIPRKSDRDTIVFPRRGDGIGGFRLISELGRGAFGRVYLAEEARLGNRAVALKVTRAEGDEPRKLARLQHTHIVPIYSVHDDPESGLRLMCMPYFGGANLAQVLEAAGTTTAETGPTMRRVERSLLEALDLVGHPAMAEPSRVVGAASLPSSDTAKPETPRSVVLNGPGEEIDPSQPARRFLRQATSIRAAVWIAARLAEGLEHAHSRGMLHRDLKPSNILIAADGTPMLLDFNLATDGAGLEGANKAMLGGTLPYMSPEHLDAFNPKGNTRPEAVDERSDIYGLGLILFEMIAGHPPFDGVPPEMKLIDAVATMTEQRRRPAPSLREANPDVPWSLDSIVRQCLDPDPKRRHARAGDLAEDLRRFLDDQPLKFAPETSYRERVAKWARRNPKMVGATPVAVLSVILLALVGGLAWSLSSHLLRVSSRLKHSLFQTSFQECQLLLYTTMGTTDHLNQGIEQAERALQHAGMENRGWGQGRSWVDSLDEEARDEARRDLTELVLLVSWARVVRAEKTRSQTALHDALELAIMRLDAIESQDPNPPRALYAERARYYEAMGDAQLAARDRSRRNQLIPRTGRDFYLNGTGFLAEGDLISAERDFGQAVRLDPKRFWSWFALGLCHFQQKRYGSASTDFAVCTALAPGFTWPWLNLGLAQAREGNLAEAREYYTQALRIDPNFIEALLNRGLVYLEMGDREAITDFQRVIALGRLDHTVQAGLAEALARHGQMNESVRLFNNLVETRPDDLKLRAARGMALLRANRELAEADFRHVLNRHPDHPLAMLGLARFHRDVNNHQAALQAVEASLEHDDSRLDAVELRAWLRGRLGDPLAIVDVNRLVAHPTRDRLYNSACALALLTEARADPKVADQAVELLNRAVALGFDPDRARSDVDLAPLRSHPRFLIQRKP